ncbi:MAG TPA: FtsX-like permease family protein [Conexibacter sp.]|nr:FtsX-like permease family protein [Conexibacter sp.]
MSLRNLVWFYRRRVRARAVQELLALVGIAVGVALLFAVQVSNRSLSASIAQLTHGLVGNAQLQLVARGPQGFDERLVGRVRNSPGVGAVAPMLVSQLNVVAGDRSRSVYMLAGDRRLVRLGGSLLSGYQARSLARLHAVVLPLPLARALGVRFGDTITLQVAGRSVEVPVGAVVSGRDVGPLAQSPVVFAPIRYAQELAGLEGRVSRLYVVPEPGQADVAERSLRRIAAGHLTVGEADYDRRMFAQAARPNDQSTALFASISALVGFLLAFNAMLLMTRERRSVIAELRISGYGFWGVVEVLMFDALVLGVAASVCGIALGDQLSRHVFQPSPGYLAIAFPVGNARTVSPEAVLLAFGTGIAAAMLATLAPLVAAFRSPTMDAVDEDALQPASSDGTLHSRFWLAIGVLGLAISTVVLVARPEAALVGVVALLASMLALLPVILSVTLRLLDRGRRRIASVVPPIAVGELQSARSRSVAIAAIAGVAVFGSTAIESAHRDLQHALDAASHQLSAVTDLWVSAAGQANTLATVPFPPSAISTIATTPHVAAVAAYRGALLDVGDRRVWVMAPPRNSAGMIPPNEVVEGDLRTAERHLDDGGWAVVSESLAKERDLQVGDAFMLDAPQSERFRVAAITTNFGWSPGAIIVNADDFQRAWGSSDVSALQVRLDGLSSLAGKRAVERALGAGSALTVETVAEREQRHRATTRAGLARLTQIATLMLTAATLAIGAAMGGMIWQRRRRMAELKLAGITQRQLWRALMLESGLLLGIGCTIGALYGLGGAQLLDRALGSVTGFPVDTSLGFGVAVGSLALVGAVASAIVLLPGYMAARVPVEAAFQD